MDAVQHDNPYQDLIENSYDLICTHDVRGKLLYINAAAERALGYERETLVGRNLQDLLVPEVRHLFPAYLAELRENGTAHGVMRMNSVNGDVREWEYHNSERRLEDGTRIVRGIAHDVTEQLKAARGLRASEQRFRALFEQAAVGVAYIDTPTGRILAANRKCASVVGYEADALLGMNFDDLVHPQDLAGHRKRMTQMARGEVPDFEIEQRLLNQNDAEVWVALCVSPLLKTGGPSDKHMVVVQEITRRKLAEEQRAELEAQLRQAQKMEAIGTLAGGIAHDFNNLLLTMVCNLELAREDTGPDHPAATSLDQIAVAAMRASQLVRQILAFSRKQPSLRTVVPLAPLIEDAAQLLRASLPAAIELDLHLNPALNVLADSTQVHQVLMNLCTNAWQAITVGRGRITVTLDEGDAPPHPNGTPFARIRVTDTGDGMDARTLERIFEPFFTTKEVGRGSGLGLSVVHGIVKSHGGSITATSEPGYGATFEVLLPVATARYAGNLNT
jgi:PAS domain S-box-containing protein